MKRTGINYKLVLFSLLFVTVSCTKSVSEMAAKKVAGSYFGLIHVVSTGAPVPSYPDSYRIKIDSRSNGAVQVSCISTPALFDTYSIPIIYANGIAIAEDQTTRLRYESTTNQLSLTVDGSKGNVSFTGTKE